jgi:hypothetical protein
MNNDMGKYEDGLEEAKRIVSAAMKMSYADALSGLSDGWLFLNFLVRKAEEEYEKYKDKL